MTIDPRVIYAGAALVLLLPIAVGIVALAGRGRFWVRVAIVAFTTLATFGTGYLALAHAPEAQAAVDPTSSGPPVIAIATAVILGETVVWVMAMLISGGRRAERQGRFHPEHRLRYR